MSQLLINAYLKELATLRRIGGTTEGVTGPELGDSWFESIIELTA